MASWSSVKERAPQQGAVEPSMDQGNARELFLAAHDAYADDIYRFCVLKVSSKEVAEDLTQETFMRFWQALRVGKVVKSDRALLYTMAHNLVIDWYRKKKESSLDQLAELGVDFASLDHLDITKNAEMAEALRAITELDEPSREALMLRYVEGLTPADIASITGESANVISVRLNRAIKKVQDLLHTHE